MANSIVVSELHNFYKGMKNGIMSMLEVENFVVEMRRRILEGHKAKITQLKNGKYEGYYQTFVRDKDNKRKIIRDKTRDGLEDKLLVFYTKGTQEEKHTIDECYQGWIDELRPIREKSTICRYERVYNRHFSIIKDKYIEDLKVGDIKSFITKEVVDKNLTIKDYGALKTNLYGIYLFARDNEYTDIRIEDVVSALQRKLRGNFRPLKKSLKEDFELVFSDSEIKMIKDYCFKSGSKLVDLGILLLFGTGMRVGELSVLRNEDVDIAGSYISVSKTEQDVSNHGDCIVSEKPKTIAGFRKVFITREYSKVLCEILNKSNPNSEFLFSDATIERYNSKKFRDRLNRICKALDIPQRSPHAIRRTYASKLREMRFPDELIIKQMGHVDISTTENYYIFNRKTDDEVITELEKVF